MRSIVDLTRMRLVALTAVRQRSRHRAFRFRFGRSGERMRVDVRTRPGAGAEGFTARAELRRGTADARCFQQIFLDESYDLRGLRRWPELWAGYQAARAGGRPPLILDAGANIGLAALYFASQWPGARIVAVEPEARNFARLQAHARQPFAVAAAYATTIVPVQAAVAGRDGAAVIVNPQASTAAYRTQAATGEGSVPAYTIPTLLARWGEGSRPWLAKIDIEGGERELFASGAEWMDQFPILIVEPHDWLLPGTGTVQPLLQALAARQRDFLIRGESIVSVTRSIA